jgi:CheY-like chemotaxis protein
LRSTVLIVDDYAPWRRSIRILLRKSEQYHVIADAADGVEAVQNALELRPHIVLMDLSLPKMSGLDATKRILAHCPEVRIVFVSEHGTADVIDAAMAAGAAGYIIKSHAARELLPALDAIVAQSQIDLAPNSLRVEPGGREEPVSRHEIGFYDDEEAMVDDYARMAATALSNGHTFAIVAGTSRWEQLRHRLEMRGTDVARAKATGRYHEFAAKDILESLVVDGEIDVQRFWNTAAAFRNQVTRAQQGESSRIVLCGECSPRLLVAGNVDAAVQLERLWDRFSRLYSIDTLCGYLITGLDYEETNLVIARLRHAHSAVRWR